MMRRVLSVAAVTAAISLAAPVASSAQTYSPSYQYGQSATSGDFVTGRIGASQPYNVWIGGLHITTHDGTVITPQGATLQPGLRVRVWGYWNGNGTFEANQIDVVPSMASAYSNPTYAQPSTYVPPSTFSTPYVPPYAANTYAQNGYGYSTDKDYLTGLVSNAQPYNVWVGSGNTGLHIRLHDGTVINPTGITLQPGMRVRVWGHWNANGTYEADQIDVVNPGDFPY